LKRQTAWSDPTEDTIYVAFGAKSSGNIITDGEFERYVRKLFCDLF
jgi:hypothetical protein